VSVLLNADLSIERTWQHDGDANAPGVLLTTSGTTGKPKVAFHVLSSLLSRALQSSPKLKSTKWLLTFHPATFAGLQVLLTVLVGGSEVVVTSTATIAGLSKAALEYRPTHVSATPTFWRGFLLALGSDCTKIPLKQITIGGEAIDQTTLNQLHSSYPKARVTHIYASTEAGALFAVNDGRAGFPAEWLDEGVEGARLRIRNEVLEVVSPRSMTHYEGGHGLETVTKDGWITTGDVVEVVGDRVYFKGRVDEIINVGGSKVNPEEVESVLLQMPIIGEARVFGIPNPIAGTLVAAEIVLSKEEDASTARRSIHSFVSERMESFKVPRILKFVPSITATALGKKSRQS
jgi:acyl-coenzyme A synthetase/AMP-(fatty) acid ligase